MSGMSAAGHTILCEQSSPRGAARASRQPHLHTGPQTAFKEKAPLALLAPGTGQRWEVKTVSGQPAGDFPGLEQRVGAGARTSRLRSDGDGHLPSLGLLSITGRREVWRMYLCL